MVSPPPPRPVPSPSTLGSGAQNRSENSLDYKFREEGGTITTQKATAPPGMASQNQLVGKPELGGRVTASPSLAIPH